MSQRFLNLIRNGKSAEVATEVEEDPSLVASRDAQGVSAFLWSVYVGQPVIRDFLLSRLPSLDLFEASSLGDCSRIEPLLEQGVHETSADGWTPLHVATDSDLDTSGRDGQRAVDLPTARLLVELGADETARTADGLTARDIARDYGQESLYDSLLRRRAA